MKYNLHKTLPEYLSIILDMDGTLYYQLPVQLCMAVELFFYYLVHINKAKELLELIKYRKSFENGRLQASTPIIDYWMLHRPLKYIHFFRDKRLLAFIERLQDTGVKIVVYSDYPVKEKIKALAPFTPDFAFCGMDDGIKALKPDTKGLLYIIGVLREPVENIVFIGDRMEKDGRCAQQLNMDYIIFGRNILERYLQNRQL